MKKSLKKEILEILSDILPSIDFQSSDTLVDDRTLDSVSIVQIISELTIEYGVNFGFEDLTPDNFNSLDSIVALVRSKLDD